MFNKYNVPGFLLIMSLVNSQECFDYELAESDFPFSHLADFTSEEDIGQYWGMEFLGDGLLGAAGGNDFAYKLTLLEPALVYITTCDSETDVDVEIAIYNSCDSTDWILYQDDSNLSVFYPDGSSEQYDFQCISGYEENPTFANMLPRLDWEAGTYYIVVSDRGYSGTVKTYIGYSLLVDSTTTNSDYTEINYHFSEGVFGGEYQDVYNGNGIALEANDYSLSIDSNGGDADEAYIISLSTMLGEELTGDERNIKINIDYPDTPSGVEQVTIGPASVSSIFNSIGIPLLDIDGITIELVDAQRPLITSIEPSDNSISVPANSNILLTFSESVFFNDNEITNENASSCFKIENIETNENLAFELSNFENIIFTLNPENNFPEFSYIRCIIFSSIEDLNNNQFVTDTVTFRTEDLTPPTIINSSLINTNEYGILSFNESVYSTNSGSGSLSITDFTLTFNSNNGNCTNVTLSGLTNNEGGGIEGGESMFRVLIQLEGAPSGVETFFLSPINNSSIYDFAGNAMLSSSTSSELTLFASASIDTFSIADSNEYVDLTFSSGIYGDNNQIQAVSVSDFNFQLNSNGGAVSSGGITHISNINNGQLSGGDQIIRLFMTFDTLPSGVETILISPVSDNSIYSLSGVPLPSSENTGLIILADQRPPEGELSIFNGQTEVIESDPLRITFSEDIYNPNTGQIITSEELIEFITLRIGDENGEDIPFLVNYSSPPDLYIVPNEDFASDEIVYYSFNGLLEDASGNPVLFNLYATFSIRDYLPPAIDSSRLALDNSYVDLFFDDEIFGGVEFDGENYFGISPVDRNDFDIQFESNGSETDSVVITSITRTDSNFLIGGEK